MSAPRTLVQKIWDEHLIRPLGEGRDLLQIDRILLHERTGGLALKGLQSAGRRVANPREAFVTMDHVVDTFPGRGDETLMPTGGDFIRQTRQAARDAGIELFDIGDPRQGIGHVISPELGLVLPGATLICPDSHTCTQGALGALAWGVGSSEAEHALATGALRVERPRHMRIQIDGALAPGTTAKDLALFVIGRLSAAGARGCAVEYTGAAVANLAIEERLTLCNLAAELAAFTAIIAPDAATFAYLAGRPYAPAGERLAKALAAWSALRSDPDATFDVEARIDGGEVAPMVTWGTSPQQVCGFSERVPSFESVAWRETREGYDRALTYMGLRPGDALKGLPIDAAFIGSCTNSRLSDLRRAASVLRGRRAAPGVRAICVPGSSAVKQAAEAEGLHRIFTDAGFEWRESGCSMCFFAGGESFGPQDRVATATNRNFENRQGPRTRSHLVSPENVAASAVIGALADQKDLA